MAYCTVTVLVSFNRVLNRVSLNHVALVLYTINEPASTDTIAYSLDKVIFGERNILTDFLNVLTDFFFRFVELLSVHWCGTRRTTGIMVTADDARAARKGAFYFFLVASLLYSLFQCHIRLAVCSSAHIRARSKMSTGDPRAVQYAIGRPVQH